MPSLFLNSDDDPVDDALIEIVAAEVRVAVGRLHLDHAFADLEDRDVEGAAAEVVDRDRLVLLLVEPVRQRRGGRLVDDPHHLETRDLAGFLGRLPLRIVEVRRDGDDRLGDRLPEILLGGLLQLLQHHRRDLRRRVLLVADLDAHIAVGRRNDPVRHHLHFLVHLVESPSHEALDREDRVLRIRDRLALGNLPDQPLARLRERHDRRRQSTPFGVGNHDGLAAFHDGHHGVGRAEVDADDFAHVVASFTLARAIKRALHLADSYYQK